jgi:hypothetical protein
VLQTSLVVLLLDISYIYEENKVFKSDFLFLCMSINFISTHILVNLNLCTCNRKLIFYAAYRIA